MFIVKIAGLSFGDSESELQILKFRKFLTESSTTQSLRSLAASGTNDGFRNTHKSLVKPRRLVFGICLNE